MTALENYKNLLETVFGSGTTTFKHTSIDTNNVIGALHQPTEYVQFKANFTARLHRLKSIYENYPDSLKEIITQANLIASSKNWEGAFAELSAFDHLNHDIFSNKTYLSNPMEINKTIDKSRTFAHELGKKEANLDGFMPDNPLFLDIKCFKDNVNEILQGIYAELKNHLGISNFQISAEYRLDISYDDFKSRRKDLLNELKAELDPMKKKKFFRSNVINDLLYRFLWGNGVLITEKDYIPYKHALNYHRLIFNNADQFVKDTPSIVVYVTFPWYNGIVTDFSNSNIQLFRSLARRVFCQYRHDSTPFHSFNSKFSGSHSIYEVSTYISGIIFLEDNTILSKEPDITNVRSFVYLNPNAKNPIRSGKSFLTELHNSEFDDFEFDNY